MWRFITDLSAVTNTEWAEKKIKTVPHSAKRRYKYNWHDENKNNFKSNFRTIIQNLLKNNKLRPNFSSFIKKKRVFGIL